MKKRNKLRGFTLVEVMTSLVIMVILIAIASGVIITTFNIFGRNALFRAAQNEGNNVYNFLYDNISYATGLKISNIDDINYEEDSYYEKVYIENEANKGCISLKRKTVDSKVNIFGDSGDTPYNFKCEVKFNKIEDKKNENPENKIYLKNMIGCTVIIKRDNEILYEKNGLIPLYNESKISEENSLKLTINDSDTTEISNITNKITVFYTYIQ